MSKKLMNAIIDILNGSDTLEQKRINIRLLSKNKHKENRLLINIISSILSQHCLPIHPKDNFRANLSYDVSENNRKKIEKIIESVNSTYFKAVCSELLWEHTHDINFAKCAIINYELELESPTEEDELTYTRMALSICRVYSKYKALDFDFDAFINNSLKYIKDNYDRPGFCILFILNALSMCNKCYEKIETAYKEAIEYYENKDLYDKAIAFLEDLEDFYKIYKNETEINNIRIKIAIDYEKQADQLNWNGTEHSHQIISLIHKSMNSWERSNSKKKYDERKRLAKRIIPVKELSMKALQSIKSGPIDISEYIEQIEEFISGASFEAVIYRLSKIIQLKSYENLKEDFDSSGFMLSQLFATTRLDSNGRVRCIIPSALDASKEELISIMEHRASEEYTFKADAFISRFLWKAKEKFAFSKDTLKFLVEDNAFVESDRQETFLNGIVAGFNLELSTAMHLLMPQVEHGIRHMAEECGAVVYKTDKNGVESSLSLESILNLPEVEECFDETFLFNLRLFYTSGYGFGMRNAVCHSMYSDKELQTARSLAVWWFTLHICCIFSSKLNERLLEQTQNK